MVVVMVVDCGWWIMVVVMVVDHGGTFNDSCKHEGMAAKQKVGMAVK
jgi:hypothetical protein